MGLYEYYSSKLQAPWKQSSNCLPGSVDSDDSRSIDALPNSNSLLSVAA